MDDTQTFVRRAECFKKRSGRFQSKLDSEGLTCKESLKDFAKIGIEKVVRPDKQMFCGVCDSASANITVRMYRRTEPPG